MKKRGGRRTERLGRAEWRREKQLGVALRKKHQVLRTRWGGGGQALIRPTSSRTLGFTRAGWGEKRKKRRKRPLHSEEGKEKTQTINGMIDILSRGGSAKRGCWTGPIEMKQIRGKKDEAARAKQKKAQEGVF